MDLFRWKMVCPEISEQSTDTKQRPIAGPRGPPREAAGLALQHAETVIPETETANENPGGPKMSRAGRMKSQSGDSPDTQKKTISNMLCLCSMELCCVLDALIEKGQRGSHDGAIRRFCRTTGKAGRVP